MNLFQLVVGQEIILPLSKKIAAGLAFYDKFGSLSKNMSYR
jgi:hypothetical protein